MTKDRFELDLLIASLRARGAVDDPAIKPLEPVIRSGDTFLFPGDFSESNGSGGAAIGDWFDEADIEDAAEDGAAAPANARRAPYLGLIVIEWGFDVKALDPANDANKHQLFRDWLRQNEPGLAGHADKPTTLRYRGTYAVYSSSEKGSGQYRTIWSARGYKGLRRLMRRMADPGSAYGTLVRSLRAFADDRPGAGRSQQIYVAGVGSRHFQTAY